LESYCQEIGRAGRDGQPSVVELLGSPDDLTILENFVYGDTPTPEALGSLLAELLQAGPTFAVSLYELANRHDIRPLVLRTALTYLELRGVLRQGTPFYASYKARLLRPLDEIVAQFRGERQAFVSDVFEQSKHGRTWYTLDPAALAAQLAQERQRVVRMLEYLAEQGEIELTVADARQRYTCLLPDVDAALVGAELAERFARREAQEIARLRQVVELIETDGCQTNALLQYFGEQRSEPCGHCTFCMTDRRTRVGALASRPAIARLVDVDALTSLRTSAPDALGHARQQARLLCGLTSPATTCAKLTKHPLFGVLDAHRFGDVLAWCAAQESRS
jgi:ATP-dependent DNA helicase RecQ